MPPLLSDASLARSGPAWITEQREEGLARFHATGMPTTAEEVWRYAPIDELDLDRFELADPEKVQLSDLPAPLVGIGPVVRVAAGRPSAIDEAPHGIEISKLSDAPGAVSLFGSLASIDDPLVALSTGLFDDALVIDVARGASISAPVVIVHDLVSGANFPRTIVRVGEGASASVIEVIVGDDGEILNVPVTELFVDDRAHLRYGSIQMLGHSAWHLGTIKATVGRDGTVSQLTAGLGAHYDRCRTDVVLAGQGASSVLRSTYFGDGGQVHDLRTLQDHAAPRTISNLLCKGAVADEARSVYTGLIKVQRGAIKSDAMQTNHNIVLSDTAHADSVPNLDISENDVRCSHASTVGPLDEDQRYYLESRGVEPRDAQRLLVHGFFRDLLDQAPLRDAAAVAATGLEGRLDRVVAS